MNFDLTIIDFWDNKNGKITVYVASEYAKSFRDFLIEKGTDCTPLSSAVYQGTKISRDDNGALYEKPICVTYAFYVESAKGLKELVNEWCSKVFYRKPMPES